jgi:hypothetical protein
MFWENFLSAQPGRRLMRGTMPRAPKRISSGGAGSGVPVPATVDAAIAPGRPGIACLERAIGDREVLTCLALSQGQAVTAPCGHGGDPG